MSIGGSDLKRRILIGRGFVMSSSLSPLHSLSYRHVKFREDLRGKLDLRAMVGSMSDMWQAWRASAVDNSPSVT